ncbi:MAG: bifunctional 4-hydroxy-2-oxoglutarate aldolase/2-dehydro-3-deoxy-phosphogluconate aldolase [Alphaproteobacteria bacterium]|nr:bifunctional 4-hydroxy-2-oxoglutarate aldolase/2-dehydro-3-deoxy-phosphogluconate aldolase [Alphaproteobacteria bacterium]
MKELFERARVVPVLIFDELEYAVPAAGALIEGGLPVLEVTLRTDAAWAALEAIVARHPDATVGVGTVLEPEQMVRAKTAGARFAVSPGFDPSLAESAQAEGLFYLPGVATASEVMAARRAGFRFLKFFPAEAAGGRAMLQSFASPFRDITFCPTGGVGPENFADYLALPNVACVGGSWVATAQDMEKADWEGIAGKATEAADAFLMR